ncbi:MAG: 5'/3'-nucleotidase SurE [Chitinivibrionales bacterium]|nr:5'/3'-nucleotidase SurE [Chitinivibrionales bacterium]
MSDKPLLLLTNDDGFASEGLRSIYMVLREHYEVQVVAPAAQQSGVGHAFTFHKPIGVCAAPASAPMPGWLVDGTPSDCVKFGIAVVLPRRPDYIVSGMNLGENSGTSSCYSGTVAAAREGAFWRVPSFAFSLCDGGRHFLADYCLRALKILKELTSLPAAGGEPADAMVFYNVNFPSCSPEQCRGVLLCRQSLAFFDDRYEALENNGTTEQYRIVGEKIDIEQSNEYDSRALLNNYTTITPLNFDATAYAALHRLQGSPVFSSAAAIRTGTQ